MELFRVFVWDGSSLDDREGGPLFVLRSHQGKGRHDNPSRYGAWYCSRLPVAAVAESIQRFRGQTLQDRDLSRPDGRTTAMAKLDLPADVSIADLDDPGVLSERGLRPSQVATRRRSITQPIAESLFADGADGLSWWSTLEGEWINVTLFHERVVRRVTLSEPPRRLSIRLPEVRQAAEHLGIVLA